MKLFVRNSTHGLGWERVDNASPVQLRRRPGGRDKGPAGLYEWMLPVAGLLFVADAFSLVHLWPPIQYLLAGLVMGSFAGRSMVVWRERGGPELHPDRVRRIEHVWALVGVAVMALAVLLQVAFA